MYAGRPKTISFLSLPQLALAFGIALFVLVLILAGQSAFKRAQETAPGLAHGLSHGADRELNGSENLGLAHRNTSTTSRGTGVSVSAPLAYRTPAVVLPPAGFGEAAFLSNGEKNAAQASLTPLHELIENVRRFDSTVWNVGGGDGSTPGAPKGSPSLLLDGLEVQAALVSHPARFPDALQDDVEQATREIRIYLETVRVAGVDSQKISDQSTVQSSAQKHLENGARVLSRLDARVGGTASSSTLIGSGQLP